MKELENDSYELSTGRKIYANCHILGINPDLEIHEGYDGGFWNEKFTQEEKREIADFVRGLWNDWANKPLPREGGRG